MDPLFEMQDVEKHFGTVIALGGVNFSVSEGECHCLLGDNGAGKSTLIKTMSGVHAPTSGRLLMRGQEVRFEDPRQAISQGIATVYQDRNEQDLIKNLEDEVIGYRKTVDLVSDLSNYRNILPDSTKIFWDAYQEEMLK